MRPLSITLIALGLLATAGFLVWATRARIRRARRMAGATNDWQARALLAEQRAAQAETVVRAGLLPHLARLLRGRLVVGLLSQRSQLLDTQQKSAERVTDLERRLAAAHGRLEDRLQEYQRRVGELQSREPGEPPSPTPTAAANPIPPAPPPAPRRSPFRSHPAPAHPEPVRFSTIVHRKQESAPTGASGPAGDSDPSAPPTRNPTR